jgi:acyl dehydratase
VTKGAVVAPTVFEGIGELRGAAGRDLGVTDWVAIDQERIDRFAEATGDHQWIHVDPARAAEGPFGSTIAHGYLTLALTNLFLPQLLEVRDVSMGVNYGLDKVRFPAPVPVGSSLRARAVVLDVEDVSGGVQVRVRITVERDGADKPACVVDSVSRFLA